MTRRRLVALALLLVGLVPGVALAAHSGDGEFKFMLAVDRDGDGHTEKLVTDLQYLRSLSTPTLDAAAGWKDGDRRGYRCGYAFLKYRKHVVGRVTLAAFKAPAGSGGKYVELQDKFMHEGVLNYDGSVPVEDNDAGGGEPAPDKGKSCPGKAPEPYEPLEGDPGPVPVVTFQHGPHAIEVRDFADPEDVRVSSSRLKYRLLSATDTKVVVLGYFKRLPVLSVYYELVPDVRKGLEVGETVPGTMHPVTLHTQCGLDCGEH